MEAALKFNQQVEAVCRKVEHSEPSSDVKIGSAQPDGPVIPDSLVADFLQISSVPSCGKTNLHVLGTTTGARPPYGGE